MNLCNIAIVSFTDADHSCIINGISKIEAMCLLKNANIIKKKWITITHKKLLLCIKAGQKIIIKNYNVL